MPLTPAAPVTAPVANALVMVPPLTATSPPAVPFAPTLMTPVAQVWPAPQAWFSAGTIVPTIVPKFSPARPPAEPVLLAVILPCA
jgi:hypothetical protein